MSGALWELATGKKSCPPPGDSMVAHQAGWLVRTDRSGSSRTWLTHRRAVRRWRAAACLTAIALSAGCGRQPSAALKKFIPPSQQAREAVAAVLEDWQSAKVPGPIDRLAVKVQIIDRQRKEGQSLSDFEILGEVPEEGVRCFAVRLKLCDPDAEFKARFVVVGIDPLWVFRQEDYDLLNHWEHVMPEEQPAGSKSVGEGDSKPEGDGKSISEELSETVP